MVERKPWRVEPLPRAAALIAVALVALVGGGVRVAADSCVASSGSLNWTDAGGSGAWSDAANWAPPVAPNASSAVFVPAGLAVAQQPALNNASAQAATACALSPVALRGAQLAVGAGSYFAQLSLTSSALSAAGAAGFGALALAGGSRLDAQGAVSVDALTVAASNVSARGLTITTSLAALVSAAGSGGGGPGFVGVAAGSGAPLELQCGSLCLFSADAALGPNGSASLVVGVSSAANLGGALRFEAPPQGLLQVAWRLENSSTAWSAGLAAVVNVTGNNVTWTATRGDLPFELKGALNVGLNTSLTLSGASLAAGSTSMLALAANASVLLAGPTASLAGAISLGVGSALRCNGTCTLAPSATVAVTSSGRASLSVLSGGSLDIQSRAPAQLAVGQLDLTADGGALSLAGPADIGVLRAAGAQVVLNVSRGNVSIEDLTYGGFLESLNLTDSAGRTFVHASSLSVYGAAAINCVRINVSAPCYIEANGLLGSAATLGPILALGDGTRLVIRGSDSPGFHRTGFASFSSMSISMPAAAVGASLNFIAIESDSQALAGNTQINGPSQPAAGTPPVLINRGNFSVLDLTFLINADMHNWGLLLLRSGEFEADNATVLMNGTMDVYQAVTVIFNNVTCVWGSNSAVILRLTQLNYQEPRLLMRSASCALQGAVTVALGFHGMPLGALLPLAARALLSNLSLSITGLSADLNVSILQGGDAAGGPLTLVSVDPWPQCDGPVASPGGGGAPDQFVGAALSYSFASGANVAVAPASTLAAAAAAAVGAPGGASQVVAAVNTDPRFPSVVVGVTFTFFPSSTNSSVRGCNASELAVILRSLVLLNASALYSIEGGALVALTQAPLAPTLAPRTVESCSGGKFALSCDQSGGDQPGRNRALIVGLASAGGAAALLFCAWLFFRHRRRSSPQLEVVESDAPYETLRAPVGEH
jgi:hypothetical protein